MNVVREEFLDLAVNEPRRKRNAGCYAAVRKFKWPKFKYLRRQNMPKVIITTQVQDPVKWEAGFRTHGDLFRTYTIRAPIHFAIAGNEVTVCLEPENLDTFKRAMESQATTEAMAFDGVKRETVKTFVLDKEMKL
jgi:hypothetical protein